MMLHKTVILVLAITLCGCQQVSQKGAAYIPDHSKDYLKSKVVAHLKVPEGLSKMQDDEAYPMPTSMPQSSELKSVNLEPPGFGKLQNKE